MIDTLLEKYAIGITIIAVCLAVAVVFEIISKKRKHKHKNKSIFIHVIQTAVLCSMVIVAAQYVDMAATDFHLSFISTPLINFITIAIIAIILVRKLFQLVNRLEKTQIKKGATQPQHVLLPEYLKPPFLS